MKQRYLIAFLIVASVLTGCSWQCPMRQATPFYMPWGSMPEGHAPRASSYDRSGANYDALIIKAGDTATLADIDGPGIIRHIWSTNNGSGPTNRMLRARKRLSRFSMQPTSGGSR